ncbi:hypothetical protein CC1G_14388 [Coprinopsis cinerea okayama7|uniref:Extracellular membrane protein CFEM domain-containing protein n=1 Tax=Coprinopsis cinerea (strain Okayama-7 / 130 / ATCC MYA-4618 / FGSC 9003) TaxID=240176 RepID=D6RM20_COPC7|nr:hypothetical protein CC1G_14388 [Coprinopsis cinerea okayama7\|eukprot:XP_002911391.1 hypothetical protein CC1G_14388 [Coprinopsis cinerea okayama7\
MQAFAALLFALSWLAAFADFLSVAGHPNAAPSTELGATLPTPITTTLPPASCPTKAICLHVLCPSGFIQDCNCNCVSQGKPPHSTLCPAFVFLPSNDPHANRWSIANHDHGHRSAVSHLSLSALRLSNWTMHGLLVSVPSLLHHDPTGV